MFTYPKKDSVKLGKRHEIYLDKIFKNNGIQSIPIVRQLLFNKYKNNSLIKQRLIFLDSKLGDRILRYKLKKYRADVKREYISLKSMQNFSGDYYIVCRHNYTECIVIDTKQLKLLEYKNLITLPVSEEPGYSYEQLIKIPHISLSEFINFIKS